MLGQTVETRPFCVTCRSRRSSEAMESRISSLDIVPRPETEPRLEDATDGGL